MHDSGRIGCCHRGLDGVGCRGTLRGRCDLPSVRDSRSAITLAGTPGATVLAGGTNGVKISSGSYITVTGITTTGSTGAGIYVSSSSNVVLGNNHVTQAGSTGVQGATSQGIYLNKVTASVVRDNLTDHNSDAGIYLTNGSTGVRSAETRVAGTRSATSATRRDRPARAGNP